MVFSELVKACRVMAETGTIKNEYCLCLAGSSIRLCCVGFEPPEIMFSSIDLMTGREDLSACEETFYCFEKTAGELKEFLPDDLKNSDGRYIYNSEEGRLAFSAEFGFLSLYSAATKETFIWLCTDMNSLEGFISHPLHMELGWWAQRNDLTFLHSAAVGINGKGILLSGAGGSGKSTLSMTALLRGMDFLSDDYLLMGRDPEPVAKRIYSSAYLKHDILERLTEFSQAVFWTCEEREKSLLDLKKTGGNIVDELPIKAIVIPNIAHAGKPSITKSKDLLRLIPLLASTSYQNRELRNPEVFHGMIKLFNALDAYVFNLTDDLVLNAEYLKGWVESL